MNAFIQSPGLRTTVAVSTGLTIAACSYLVLQDLSTYGLVATVLCFVCTTVTVRHALADATRYGQRLALGTLLPPVLVFLPLLYGAAIAFVAGLLAFLALLALCAVLFAVTREPADAWRRGLLTLAAWTALMASFAWALSSRASMSATLAPLVSGLVAVLALVLAAFAWWRPTRTARN